MYINSEFERLNKELNRRLFTKGQKIKKVWLFLLVATLLICGLFILFFPNQFNNEGTVWIMPVYGGIALSTTLVGFIISIKYKSEKPFFEYLYNEVIQKINLNEGLFLEYKSYEKTDKEFNYAGGMFTKHASIKVRRHVSGVSENEHHFDVYDCTMTTSNGKSQTVHFDGFYYVLNKQLNTTLQVRTSGSPKLKGVKYDRLKEYEEIKVYKPINQSVSNIDDMFIRYVKQLNDSEEYKRVYLSIVDGSLHLGITPRKNILRKQKIFDLAVLNNIADELFDEYKLINELEKLDHFNY